MSLKKKLMLTMIGIAVLPIVLLGSFCYGYFKQVLLTDIQQSELQHNSQTIYVMDSFFQSLEKISDSLLMNPQLTEALERAYSGPTARVLNYRDKQNIEDVLYRNGYYLDNRIATIAVFPENSDMFYYCTKHTINPNYDVKEESWYEEVVENEGALTLIGVHENLLVQPDSTGENKYCVTLGRSLHSPRSSRLLGVVLINVGVQDLRKLWPQRQEDPQERFYLLDSHSRVVYSDIEEEIGGMFFMPELGGGVTTARVDGALCDIMVSESSNPGWKGVKLIMRSKLNREIAAMPYISILLGLLLICLAVVMAHFLSKVITRPLQELYTKLCSFEAQKSGADFRENQVGIKGLSNSYNSMIEEINNLTVRNYETQTRLRKTELLALQFQINPHFVYNTISSIKWMAEMQGSKRMVTALESLIKLLQFSSKNDRDMVPIRDEVLFIKDYLNLINLKYFDKIQADIKMGPDTEDCATLRFLLQPIVENSICHGFSEFKQPYQDAAISVDIRRDSGRIVYEVTDNGKGMTQEQIQRALESEHPVSSLSFNKIGLYNVQKRIQYTFGSQYGVRIDSKPGEYTRVLVEIPARAYKEGDNE